MLATYLIPLALTIIVNFVGVALYWNTVVPMVYAICIALVCIPGWIVTLTIWSGCHERSYDTVAKCKLGISLGKNVTQIMYLDCYQYYLEYENRNWRGLQQGLNYGYMVISSVIIAM
jgi:hypothetical protein